MGNGEEKCNCVITFIIQVWTLTILEVLMTRACDRCEIVTVMGVGRGALDHKR